MSNKERKQAKLKVTSWTLRTPTLQATLTNEHLTFMFGGGGMLKQIKRDDVEALTRFLNQYANVQPENANDLSDEQEAGNL
jgi:hypothetical protein